MSEFTKGKLTANGRRLEIEGRKGYTGNYRVADAYANTALSNCPSLDEAQANAARLAHCWNCHDELVEALKNLTEIIEVVGEKIIATSENPGFVAPKEDAYWQFCKARVTEAKAALSKSNPK